MRTLGMVKYAYMIFITIVAIYFYMESSKMSEKVEELENEINELTITRENTSTNTLNGLKNNLSPIISNNVPSYQQKINSNVQFGIGQRPRQMRLGKDCDTCVWKLKKSCTIKDENGNQSWDPRCEGNNATNGFICSFRDAKYDVECNDRKCKGRKGSCNEENLQKMYKKWYVTNV